MTATNGPHQRIGVLGAAAAALLLVLVACGTGDFSGSDEAGPGPGIGEQAAEIDTDVDHDHPEGTDSDHEHPEGIAADGTPVVVDDHSVPSKLLPLRAGERRVEVQLPTAYTPSVPGESGTDDYRCFILDPKLAKDAYITGVNVLPDNTDIVHHAILFRIQPDRVAAALAEDRADPGPGYGCFGDAGMAPGELTNLDDAPWVGAWAPGATEARTRKGFGREFPQGSRIVMQIHYNLLDPDKIRPDRSATQIRVLDMDDAPADMESLSTFLTPGPVELPCRDGKASSPLCDRTAAMADNKSRFGEGPGSTNDRLHFLCNSPVVPSEVTSCTRTIGRPMTILAAGGHMHLLGKQIKIQTNVGTKREKTLLDKKLWDFDDQGSTALTPIRVEQGDQVTITCTHSQELRDYLPEFKDQPDRYVVWGQGTTDEMCLGNLTVAYG